jgi:integrase
MTQKRVPEGITVRHGRSCPARDGGRCRCDPSYQAQVWSARDEKRLSRSFPTLAAAKAWRHDALVGVRRGTVRASGAPTLHEAATEWLQGAREGSIRNRSGDRYKPSALRGYEQALRDRILPDLGGAKLSDIRRSDVQRLVNHMLAAGLNASTIRNSLLPLRAIYRQALALDEVAVNPTAGLQLPAVRGTRDRIASPDEAAWLIDALPVNDRAIWATAMYAGLRLGELLALDWDDVDLAAGVIRVERSYDPRAGVTVKPKSRAGRRTVPIAAILRDELLEHRMRQGREVGLVFGRSSDRPFNTSTIWDRARRTWAAAGLIPIGLHECRHTFASLMIAAGVNAKALAAFMGHSSVTITLDRYGHLMPGSEDEAAGLLDAYLERANTQARLAALDGAAS